MKTDTEYYFRGNSRGQRDRGKPKEIKRLLNNLVLMIINLKKSFKPVYPVFFLSTLSKVSLRERHNEFNKTPKFPNTGGRGCFIYFCIFKHMVGRPCIFVELTIHVKTKQ